LVSHSVVQLIEVATTKAGMTVTTTLEKNQHRANVNVSGEEMVSMNRDRQAPLASPANPHT
jgi:hypothetical protein